MNDYDLDAVIAEVAEAARQMQEEPSREPGEFTLGEYAERTGSSERSARRDLKRLVEAGLVVKRPFVMEGTHTWTMYRYVGKKEDTG